MKKVIDRASSRGYFNHGWLKTHHTFSFANYYNPERIHFGALYVVLALDKFSEVAAGHFILAVGRYRLGYAYKLLHIVIVLLEQ